MNSLPTCCEVSTVEKVHCHIPVVVLCVITVQGQKLIADSGHLYGDLIADAYRPKNHCGARAACFIGIKFLELERSAPVFALIEIAYVPPT